MATAESKARLFALGLKEVRHKAQTDLYYLAKEVLGYDLVEKVHGPVCEFFVHKDPGRSFQDQDTCKQRLLLDPRGHFKTTLDICDIVQWILCFPDIRILIMSGTRDLAKRMLAEVKHHFQYNEKLRGLFPEFCPKKQDDFGNSEEFTVPNRKKRNLREPTVTISTVDSVKAGSHYDIIKCDDLVNENNSKTREQLEDSIRAFHYTTPILEPLGYRDVIGTRYDYSDLYGTILDANDPSWKTFVRPVWTDQPDGSKELLFPERFAVDKLLLFQKDDPYLFNCQYLNNPIPGETQVFSPELMKAHFIPWTQIPKEGRVFVAWDLGFSKEQHADWSVGAVGMFDDKGRLFVLDIIRGRYLPHELVNAIVTANIRYKPNRMGIEQAGGSNLLSPALDSKARELRMYLPIDWIKPSNKKRAKEERINGLEALLRQEQLWFSNAMANKERLIEEFARFPKFKHDDVPDAVSMLLFYKNRQDIEWPADKVEFVAAETHTECLGAGLVG